MIGTTVKIKFLPAKKAGEAGVLCYQVTRKRIARLIGTAFRVYASEWDGSSEAMVMPAADEARSTRLQHVRERLRQDKALLRQIIVALDDEGWDYTADEVVALYEEKIRALSLRHFMQDLIRQFRQLGKARTAETYQTTLNSFMRYREEQDLRLDEMDAEEMRLYEAWLGGRGLCPNSTSFYMRILRAVYNRAVEQELIDQKNPFRHVYTGIDRTVKRALPLHVMKQLKALDLAAKPRWDFARDLFLLSFYTRGMAFVDLAFLKKTDLEGGVLAYRRRKTGRQLFVKWEPCMARIVAKYACRCPGTPYLLPIIRQPGDRERAQYKYMFYEVNASLKKVGRMLGLTIPLTMYCARHGWASIAQSKNVPLSVISEGMGHTSEKTTRIYLASLNANVIDKANRLILNAL